MILWLACLIGIAVFFYDDEKGVLFFYWSSYPLMIYWVIGTLSKDVEFNTEYFGEDGVCLLPFVFLNICINIALILQTICLWIEKK